MTHAERDLIIRRAAAARLRLPPPLAAYFVSEGGPVAQWRVAEAAERAVATARSAALMSHDEAVALAVELGEWGAGDADQLVRVTDDIENLKVSLYEAVAGGAAAAAAAARSELAAARAARDRLLGRRDVYATATAEAAAASARVRDVVALGLRRWRDGRRVWRSRAAAARDRTDLLDRAAAAWVAAQPTPAQVREVARTDPWRSVWAAGKGRSFGRPAAALTDLQRALVSWSLVYQSAREAAEPPPERVVEDDDAFDGWLIARRRAAERPVDAGQAAVNAAADHPAIRNAEGCFLVQPEGLDEAAAAAWVEQVYGYNGEDGKAIIAARMAALDRSGAASELAAPERQLARRLSANKGGGG